MEPQHKDKQKGCADGTTLRRSSPGLGKVASREGMSAGMTSVEGKLGSFKIDFSKEADLKNWAQPLQCFGF